MPGGGHRGFIGRRGFRDDDVLNLIGLGHLKEADLDQPGPMRKLKAQHRALERTELDAGGYLEANIARLGEMLGLDPCERQVLSFLVTVEVFPELKEALDYAIPSYRGQVSRLIALTLRLAPAEVDNALSREGRLRRAGILGPSRVRFIGASFELSLLDGLAEALVAEFDHLDAAFEALFTPAGPPRWTRTTTPTCSASSTGSRG